MGDKAGNAARCPGDDTSGEWEARSVELKNSQHLLRFESKSILTCSQ